MSHPFKLVLDSLKYSVPSDFLCASVVTRAAEVNRISDSVLVPVRLAFEFFLFPRFAKKRLQQVETFTA